MEISGQCGEFWQKQAQERLKSVEAEYECGRITVDEAGVARNCIGRIVTSEIAELLEHSGCCPHYSNEATYQAHLAEQSASTREYIRQQILNPVSEEQKNEMRAAFGSGCWVVDAITGRRIQL